MDDVRSRLAFLVDVGVGYVALDRPLRTLSGGEAQRVALTSTLGSSLVDMLYVLDEPSVGLHPADVEPLATAIEHLRDRGNTVVVVEHEEEIIRRAERSRGIRPRRRRRRRPNRFPRHAARHRAIPRQPHRRLARRPTSPRRQQRAAPPNTAGSNSPAPAATICKTSPSNFRSACSAW